MNLSAVSYWLARAGLCLAYAYSGVAKLLDFHGAMAEQAHFGLSPPALFAGLTIAVQLGGFALIALIETGRLAAPSAAAGRS